MTRPRCAASFETRMRPAVAFPPSWLASSTACRSSSGRWTVIISKVALPRRTFLRGLGVAIGLPLLDAMVPALAVGAPSSKPIRRLGFVYAPDGMAITSAVDYWRPKGDGAALEMSPILQPLEPYRRKGG